MELNREEFLKGFTVYTDGKKKQALYLKLFFLSLTFIVLAVLYYAYSIVDTAMDKVIVVNTGGEMLPVESSEQETLYRELLKTHCYSVSYYVNSFDVNNIRSNQARAAFLVNQTDLNSIFGEYQVVFSSTLSITDNQSVLRFKVLSTGKAIRVKPRYPENPTGFYFTSYTQEYYPINEE